MNDTPARRAYDVVIVGGALMGTAVAWFLTQNEDFDGSVLIVERDPSYEFTSTSRTNSCIRQQFSTAINVKISQFGAEFIHRFRDYIGEPDTPEIILQSYGYMYLADTPAKERAIREAHEVQVACGAATRLMTPDQIAAEYPFYNLDGVILGSHNPVDEGYFDGGTMFDQLRKSARARGVEYVRGEVVSMTRGPDRIESVTLASGDVIACGTVVNAAGPRAALVAAMAGAEIPVEPRRRYTFIFDAANPLEQDLPLTIDPSGVHMRTDGRYYLAGCPPDEDPAVDFDDFAEDHSVWEEKVWPAIANRVPQFEAVKLINSWIGHYAFNTLDQNAIVGPHDEIGNFIFVNGFSGHGFQQHPAVGRGVAELIAHGAFRTLDLSPFSYNRIRDDRPLIEKAVI